MNVTKMEYKLEKVNQENVEVLLTNLGFNLNNYFIAMTQPSIMSRALIGSIVDFNDRFCIICFSEKEINLIMLSRIDSKKVTEIIKIDRNEIKEIQFSNVLISYMLKIQTPESTMRFQVFKKHAKFPKIKNSIELFKKII